MACLNISVSMCTSTPIVGISRQGGISCDVTANRISIAPRVSRKGEPLIALVTRKVDLLKATVSPCDKRLNVTCGIICTVNDYRYLEVTPETIWLGSNTFDSAEFNIYTNINWVIH